MTLKQMYRRAKILDNETIPDDIRELAMIEAKEWRPRQRQLKQRDEKFTTGMQAAFAPFRTLLGPEPPIANQTQVAAAAITLLWDTPNLTPLPPSNVAGSPLAANTVYKVNAWGVTTSAVTAGATATFTPGFGTTSGATSLGASVAYPIIISLTNVMWVAEMWVHFRTIGAAGLATCGGFVDSQIFAGFGSTAATNASAVFGTASTTATTVVTTAAQGLTLCVTPSLATNTWQTLGVVAESLN